tara:strand:+ start:146 stop:613 length:468 start_codon:yes stop_codon:yes gene_type:complete
MTDKEALRKLVIRSLAGTGTSIAGVIAIKKFDLTLFSTSQNISPIITVILSYFILGDKIKCEDVLLLFIVVTGIFITKICGFFPDLSACRHTITNRDVIKSKPSVFDYLVLVYIPLGIAFTNILLRKMKGLHFIQLSVYKIIIALVISVIISLAL